HALAQELAEICPEEGVKLYQYIDDLLIDGPDVTPVGQTQTKVVAHLENLRLKIPTEKIQFLSPEVKFLGIRWKGGVVCIPPETLTALEMIKMPENKKELQHIQGLLTIDTHIGLFHYSLYDLTRKGVTWDWTPIHEKTLKLLIFEAGIQQALGKMHPTDS
ncbi:TF26 protein, partial [Geococcyx californianus]|nr:TF26 protein [Geococcyx californianus]